MICTTAREPRRCDWQRTRAFFGGAPPLWPAHYMYTGPQTVIVTLEPPRPCEGNDARQADPAQLSKFAPPAPLGARWAPAHRLRRRQLTKCSGEARFLFGARRANPRPRSWSRSATTLWHKMIKCRRCGGPHSRRSSLQSPTRRPETRQEVGCCENPNHQKLRAARGR